MKNLQQLQSRYADVFKKNSKLPKNLRRYTQAFKVDVARYLAEGGNREELAKVLDISPKSIANWTNRPEPTSEIAKEVPAFLKIQNTFKSDGEISITYPSGLILKLPMK